MENNNLRAKLVNGFMMLTYAEQLRLIERVPKSLQDMITDWWMHEADVYAERGSRSPLERWAASNPVQGPLPMPEGWLDYEGAVFEGVLFEGLPF